MIRGTPGRSSGSVLESSPVSFDPPGEYPREGLQQRLRQSRSRRLRRSQRDPGSRLAGEDGEGRRSEWSYRAPFRVGRHVPADRETARSHRTITPRVDNLCENSFDANAAPEFTRITWFIWNSRSTPTSSALVKDVSRLFAGPDGR